MKYKFKLDFVNQWKGYCAVDLIQIGYYGTHAYKSICFTLCGFGMDIEFWRKDK